MQNPDAALATSPLRLLDDDTYRTMCALLLPPMFIPSASFQGARPGYTLALATPSSCLTGVLATMSTTSHLASWPLRLAGSV